ncbi:MAG TPA: ABC transporter permease [Vicinamibacteria bacterium]|nr:ABC transporter permease [Vicinamibacteria bacterium]
MHRLRQDLLFALRAFARKPSFTLLAAAMLSLGIGTTTAIFSVVNAVVLRPLAYDDPEELFIIGALRDGKIQAFSAPEFVRLREESRGFERVATAIETSLNLVGEDDPVRVEGARISADLLPVLGVEPILGRNLQPSEERSGSDHVVLLSHASWERRFGGDPGILGHQVTLNGRSHTVIAVLPEGFSYPSKEVDLYVPVAFSEDELSSPGGHFLGAVGRLAPGVDADSAIAEADAIVHRAVASFTEHRAPHGATALPLQAWILRTHRSGLLILAASVGLVLMIACANVANLLLVRAAERRREIAVRTALGAGRLRLVRQLLTESLLLAVVGGVGGLLIALWGVDLVVRLSPPDVPRIETVAVDWTVLAFASAISLTAGVLFGLFPSLQASRSRVESALHNASRGEVGGRDARSRRWLVAFEVALALMLLVGAGLTLRSFWILGQEDPGFDPDRVLTARMVLPDSRYAEGPAQVEFADRLLEEVRALPGVRSASFVSPMPMTSVLYRISIRVPGREPPAEAQPLASNWRAVSLGYFSTMGIPLLAGRDFEEGDWKPATEGRSVIVVNETFARNVFRGEDALGKLVQIGYNEIVCEVVGVVGDVRHADLATEAGEEVYTLFAATPLSEINLAVAAIRDGDPLSLAPLLREAVWRVDPDQPIFGVQAMPELVRASVASRRFVMILIGAFALVALVLAALGIYGVVSYSVVQRTREIGVRVALGARGGEVLKLVLGQGLATAALGATGGLAGALLMSRFLESQLYGISATDVRTYAATAAVLLLVAAAATAFPAFRASRLDPITALRHE